MQFPGILAVERRLPRAPRPVSVRGFEYFATGSANESSMQRHSVGHLPNPRAYGVWWGSKSTRAIPIGRRSVSSASILSGAAQRLNSSTSTRLGAVWTTNSGRSTGAGTETGPTMTAARVAGTPSGVAVESRLKNRAGAEAQLAAAGGIICRYVIYVTGISKTPEVEPFIRVTVKVGHYKTFRPSISWFAISVTVNWVSRTPQHVSASRIGSICRTIFKLGRHPLPTLPDALTTRQI